MSIFYRRSIGILLTLVCLLTVMVSPVMAATVNVTSVSLSKKSTTINVGSSETLTAKILPSNATNKTVSWKSSNTAVVTVDKNGKITGKSVGTATISATTANGSKTATCAVKIVMDRNYIIKVAKSYIGTPHSILDCSHFVNKVYNEVGLSYDYVTTKGLDAYKSKFTKVPTPMVGDIILFGSSPSTAGHMGIVVDPQKKQFIGSQGNDKSGQVAVTTYDGLHAWGNSKYDDHYNYVGYYGIYGFYRYNGLK